MGDPHLSLHWSRGLASAIYSAFACLPTDSDPRILERMKDGARFLDIGCHVGSDLRRLVFDGAPSENMFAIDIVSHWDVGFALFNDKDHFKAQFMEADLMAAEMDPHLKSLNGKTDVISVSAVFHQWNWLEQANAAEKIVAFSKPGSLVVGYQIGNMKAHEVKKFGQIDVDQWRQDPASFAKMWDVVGDETGSRWEAQVRLLSWEEMGWDAEDYSFMLEGDAVLDFVVTRLE